MNMNKIVPILSLIAAAAIVMISVLALITSYLSVAVPQMTVVAAPTTIIGITASALSVGLTAFFLRSKLCRIAFFIDVSALIISTAALILRLVA